MSTDRDPLKHYTTMAAQAAGDKIDVLAVMEVCAEQLTFDHLPMLAGELSKARAAVAELITSSRAIDERIAYYASLGEDETPNIEQWAYTDQSGDVSRLRKALARAGSTP